MDFDYRHTHLKILKTQNFKTFEVKYFDWLAEDFIWLNIIRGTITNDWTKKDFIKYKKSGDKEPVRNNACNLFFVFEALKKEI